VPGLIDPPRDRFGSSLPLDVALGSKGKRVEVSKKYGVDPKKKSLFLGTFSEASLKGGLSGKKTL
jgi:hypothetical protein